jgi:hypothetical protein
MNKPPMTMMVADLGLEGDGWNRSLIIGIIGEVTADNICWTIYPP